MSSLLTEILISLVVIAIIGGIIGYLVRGAQLNHREVDMDQDLKDSRGALEEAQSKIARLEASMKQLNGLRKTEREKLEQRVRELEPLFDIVEKRDARIRELTEELNTAQSERQAELDQLQFDMNTRALLDDDESEVGRLQNELRLANRQRESAISRYQAQVRQIEDLENALHERERLAEELTARAESSESARSREHEELAAELATAKQAASDREEELALLQNRKQYELSLLTSRAEQAERQLESLREAVDAAEARQRELDAEVSDLRDTLAARDATIAELERAGQAPAAVAMHAVPSPAADGHGLQSLKGIGRATEDKLNSLGIRDLVQIAELTSDDIQRICQSMPSFETQLKRYDWINNARRLTGEGSRQSG